MVRYPRWVFAIITGLAILGCSNGGTEMLKSSKIIICGQQLSLGQKIKGNLLSENHISYKPEVDAYYITCERPGTYIMGKGYEHARFEIKEVTFSLNSDSRIANILGIWIVDKENRAIDNIQEIQKIKEFLGAPAADAPLTWHGNGTSVYIGEQQMDLGMVNFVQLTN